MKETILLTGSTGFIGQRLLHYLAEEKCHIKVLLRPESPQTALPFDCEIVRGSFDDSQTLAKAVRGTTHIMHLAGVTKARDEDGYDAGNVMPLQNLLAAVRHECPDLKRFLYVSSLAAAGPAPEGITGLTESDAPAPVSAYGRSKLRAETSCHAQARHIPITIVRPPAVYGPGDKDVLQIFQMMAKGVLIGAGHPQKQRFSLIYVDDLVTGMVQAMRAENAVNRTYYLTSPTAYSWNELIAQAQPLLGFKKLRQFTLPMPFLLGVAGLMGAIGELQGKVPLINRDKVNELVQNYWVCSGKQAQLDFGFTATTPLQAGLATTIAWYRKKGWL